MRIFESSNHLFNCVKPHTNEWQLRFESFTTSDGTHVDALSHRSVNSIIAVAMKPVTDPLKSQGRQVGIYST
jgi:hypothetical protein